MVLNLYYLDHYKILIIVNGFLRRSIKSTTGDVFQNCPDGSKQIGSLCYIVFHGLQLGWHRALAFCREYLAGELANLFEVDELFRFMNAGFPCNYNKIK